MNMLQDRRIELPCPTCGQTYSAPNGLYLRQLREKALLNQRDFGKSVDVSSPYISDIERNRRACPPHIHAAYLALNGKKKPTKKRR